jgi:hypothetical protein
VLSHSNTSFMRSTSSDVTARHHLTASPHLHNCAHNCTTVRTTAQMQLHNSVTLRAHPHTHTRRLHPHITHQSQANALCNVHVIQACAQDCALVGCYSSMSSGVCSSCMCSAAGDTATRRHHTASPQFHMTIVLLLHDSTSARLHDSTTPQLHN